MGASVGIRGAMSHIRGIGSDLLFNAIFYVILGSVTTINTH